MRGVSVYLGTKPIPVRTGRDKTEDYFRATAHRDVARGVPGTSHLMT